MDQPTHSVLQSTLCSEELKTIMEFPDNQKNLTSAVGFSEPSDSLLSVEGKPFQMVADDRVVEPSPSEENESSISSSSSGTSSTVNIPVRRKRSLEDKICRVCGDKAVAHNFDVISCGSCRAFFRRNALKRDKIQDCVFQTPCQISIKTRRFCSACRLKKCFTIGMRADMVKKDERQNVNPAKIARKLAETHSSDSKVDGRLGSQKMFSQQQSTSYPQTKETPDSPPHIKFRLKPFQPVSVDQLPSDPLMYWRLTDEEQALLTRISVNYESHVSSLLQAGDASEQHPWIPITFNLEDLLTTFKAHADNAVKLMKGFHDFRMLEVEDQLACLKGCSMNTFILMGISGFLLEQNAWTIFGNKISCPVLCHLMNNEENVYLMNDFCRRMKVFLKNDPTVYALLQCVIIFDPSFQNIRNRQQVNMMREKYLLLYKHYLESQVSYIHGQQYIMHVVEKLNEMNFLSEVFTDMFRKWTDILDPLMVEILSFD